MTNYPQESIKPYNEDEKKSVQVERMFDNIAPAYDQLNHTLSWGIDKSWRKKAINWLKPFQPQRMMDVATGTGDNYFDIQINVEDISDDYDVEQLANKIRSMIYEDATYRNVNAVSHISR